MGRFLSIAGLSCGLLLSAGLRAVPPKDTLAPLPRPRAESRTNDLLQRFGTDPLKWLPDWDAAQRLAARDNRSVLAYFYSPLCSWCQRTDQEILVSPDVRRRLAAFVLIKVNILEDEKTPARLRVRGTPTILILSPEGNESLRLDGYTEKAALIEVLDDILANRLRSQDDRIQSLIRQLQGQKLPASDWPDIAMALGNERHREKVQQALLALRPPPRQELVRLLQHPLLAVRLGALEALEELVGDDFGFNPWLDPATENKDPLQKWLAWSAAPGATNADQATRYRVLSPEEIANYLADLVADDLERSTRARHMLVKSGLSCLDGIKAFLATHPDLPAGSASKLRELRYTLLLPPLQGLEPSSLAHRLVFGNLDVRLKALRDAAAARHQAVPVIVEFLDHSEPLVRETAIDALVTAGGRKIVGLLETHLRKESDANVIYVVLRQLGNLHSKKGLDILLQYASHPNEDLAIIALESIGKLRVDTVGPQIGKCLEDPRWRVRAAALKAAEVLSLKSLAPKVTALLDDKDDFVRSAAVEALAKLGAQEALPKLEALFVKDDNLKGPIVNALYAADVPISESMVKVLVSKPPSVVLSVLDRVETADLKLSPLLTACAAHPDPDVACACLQMLARTGLEHWPYQKAVAQQIQSGDRRRKLAIMSSVRLETKAIARYNPAVRRTNLDQPADPLASAVPAARPNAAADVLAAFESASPGPAAPGSKSAPVDDVFSAFGMEAGNSENCVEALLRVGRQCLQNGTDAELQSAAARMLVHLGGAAGVPQVLKDLPQLALEQRVALTESASRVRNREGLPLIQRLLADPAAEVRQAACGALLEGAPDESCLRLLLSELQRPGALLKSHEAFPGLVAAAVPRTVKPLMARPVQEWLKNPKDETMTTLALILLAKVWTLESEKLVEPFLSSANPWQRRAAFFALARNARERFFKEAGRVASDSSEYVREVLPYAARGEGTTGIWIHYFDDRNQSTDYDYFTSERREQTASPPEVLEALRKLAHDPSERVRFDALFALITREQSVDLGELSSLVEKMPRDSERLERLSSHVLNHFATLGKEFVVLLPYLDFRTSYDPERAKQVYEHFGFDEDEPLPAMAAAGGGASRRVIASYMAAPAGLAAQPPRPENYQVVYFTKPGCKECAAVSGKLEQLREPFPHLAILELDINKTASVLLNEALSKRFGVPASIRLVAPSIFSGGGYLIKDDITLDRLGQMLVRASTVPLTNWLAVPKEDLAMAHDDIVHRYQATSLGLVLSAGLLDGINPCAFATIIFLLSYLQVSRKSPRATLQVGLAYVCGVFLAYFLIGLGLARLTAMVARLSWAGTLLTYAMAAFALAIMALNIRDGFLCLQGHMAEMTLQLPDALKNRIHIIIRHSVRQAHFVLVALFLGVAISFLELACTGQVYLPTITYMIQQGEKRAVWNLLAYNLAFILPLAVVFALSCLGLRSETLVRLLKRRAAWVKFSTALLFLLLAVFLLLGHRFFS